MVKKTIRPNLLFIILYVLILGLLWVLSGWNTYNSDIDNYMLEYGYVQDGGFSLSLHFGYSFLQYLFVLFDVDYYTYRIIIYGLGLLLLGYLIYKWSPYRAITLLLFIALHFLRDVVETRNFLASLCILVLIEAFGREGRTYKFYIVAIVFLAFSIHLSFFLCFVLLFVENNKWHYWNFLFACFVLSFIFQRFYLSGGIYMFSNVLLGEEKIDEIMEILPRYAVYVTTILMCFNGICLNYFNKSLRRDTTACSVQLNHLTMEKFSWIINNMNILSNTFIIFTVINGAFFSRIFVNIAFLNIIYFLNVTRVIKNKRQEKIVLILVYTAVFSYFTQIIPFPYHFQMVVNNNSIL